MLRYAIMDRSLLEAALVGYRIEAERITKAIEDISSRLKGHVVTRITPF
jgi:hypothetical protein